MIEVTELTGFTPSRNGKEPIRSRYTGRIINQKGAFGGQFRPSPRPKNRKIEQKGSVL